MSAPAENGRTLKETGLCVNPAVTVVMAVTALNTLVLGYPVDSHCSRLTAHWYWVCPGTWDLLQTSSGRGAGGLAAIWVAKPDWREAWGCR